eukprot:Gb_16189 [translate_table: standard]
MGDESGVEQKFTEDGRIAGELWQVKIQKIEKAKMPVLLDSISTSRLMPRPMGPWIPSIWQFCGAVVCCLHAVNLFLTFLAHLLVASSFIARLESSIGPIVITLNVLYVHAYLECPYEGPIDALVDDDNIGVSSREEELEQSWVLVAVAGWFLEPYVEECERCLEENASLVRFGATPLWENSYIVGLLNLLFRVTSNGVKAVEHCLLLGAPRVILCRLVQREKG